MQKLLLLVFLFLAGMASAQESSDVQVPEITVFGATPKSSTLDLVPTVSELSGTRLERKKQATIGETLARETGVTSSQFGPNASRPVIRGMEGDRIRILQNGTGVLDASTVSQDHAVAVDPLIVDRVEIVRGPAALLYGSSAVGGVVNMVTNRIPEKMPANFTGKAETKFSTTDMGRAAGAGADAPITDHWVVHVDGGVRANDDYHVPGYARTAEKRAEEPLTPEDKKRVYNSFGRTSTEAIGTSYVFKDGFLGTSFSNYDSTYGSPAERPVQINMLQQRWDVSGESREVGFLKSIRVKNTYSHYKHDEVEGGELSTTFKNDGDEARIDMRHRNIGPLSGVFGLQSNIFTFSAIGEEAFLPGTDNRILSGFVYEEMETGAFKPSFGARFDSSKVTSKTDSTFGAGESRSFSGGSLSLGFLYQITPANSLVLNGAYTERAPNYEELFAHGRHVATAQNEVGLIPQGIDPRKERSQSVELSWRHKGTDSQGRAGVFLQDFKDFVTLVNTGISDGDPEEPFDIYNYSAVEARIYGAEAEYRHQLGSLIPGGNLEIELKADALRGINRQTGDSLPRMTPFRKSLGLLYKANSYQADLEIQRSERQTHVAPNETRTAAYTLVNLGAEIPVRMNSSTVSLLARVNNVFDQEARNHVSVLKDITPLPGRNFILGAQATF